MTDDASCQSAIAEAAEALGGIDALVYAPGIGPLARLVDTDAQMWRDVFDTNVTGAALVTRAAIPHLTASGGKAAYLSSVSASLTPPWPGLGAYAVSKAALDKLVEAWRAEHPSVGFTRVVVGDCAGGEGESTTEFNRGWDMELASELAPVWIQRGYLSGSLVAVDELIDVVHAVLGGADDVGAVGDGRTKASEHRVMARSETMGGGERTVRSFCRICTAVCGILVDVSGDQVVRVRGDSDHPFSHGYTCPKGRALPAAAPPPGSPGTPADARRRRARTDDLGCVPRRSWVEVALHHRQRWP